MSRRYTNADLKGLTKKQLIKIIESSPENIPSPFNRSKIRKEALKDLLLSPNTPFRTLDPPLDDEVDEAGHEREVPHSGNSNARGSQSQRSMTSRSFEADRDEPAHPDAMNERTDPMETAIGDCGNMELRLYIQDARYVGSIREKTSKTVNVEGTLVAPNTVQIYTWEVIRELQAGCGAITGANSVRVGVQDLTSPDYTEFFIESVPSLLHTAPTDPATHLIKLNAGSEPFLRLLVDDSHPSLKTEAPHAEEHNSLPAPNDRTQVIQWLRAKAAEQDGYQLFINSKHRSRQNFEVCRSWKFAAEFSRRYYKQIHPFQLSNGKIKKSDIYHALDVKETWLTQAEEAGRIIQTFGDGGTHPSPEVISKLSKSDDVPQGSVHLFQFLKDWQRNHPPEL